MAGHRENVVSLEGNLTRDPEMRFTQNGTAVCNFGLAQSIKRGDAEIPQFFNITVWQDLAERVAESFGKGDRIVVIGRLEFREWEDKEGNKRSTHDVVADSVGASVRWATVEITKVKANGGPNPENSAYAPDGSEEPF